MKRGLLEEYPGEVGHVLEPNRRNGAINSADTITPFHPVIDSDDNLLSPPMTITTVFHSCNYHIGF